MRPWFSGITRPCQGRDGSPILPGRTFFCLRSLMDRMQASGACDMGSIPIGGASYIYVIFQYRIYVHYSVLYTFTLKH
ncbi:MAG: hypothetical protein US50_C0004G0033 [Candidatus Nomurabacteria bacterium GW2011_GWB1_37_5]|uniref:Uncharacterized protein n=1 Tax=Candidatus Nomurabacteria bacterium GW2011_GWB1_37_5 TaxID=1618742 RepID=A0A0G0JGE3_9BACT|nr:MAG: hypothetical protein US50_C0004G0033 [Candidatus Nomurabacteria bacterium GW2011_GWB1_37_5]